MTDAKDAMERIRDALNDYRVMFTGKIRREDLVTVLDRLESAEEELDGLTQMINGVDEVRKLREELIGISEELESARRIIDDLGVACEDEVDLPELETLIVRHKRRFGGRNA